MGEPESRALPGQHGPQDRTSDRPVEESERHVDVERRPIRLTALRTWLLGLCPSTPSVGPGSRGGHNRSAGGGLGYRADLASLSRGPLLDAVDPRRFGVLRVELVIPESSTHPTADDHADQM